MTNKVKSENWIEFVIASFFLLGVNCDVSHLDVVPTTITTTKQNDSVSSSTANSIVYSTLDQNDHNYERNDGSRISLFRNQNDQRENHVTSLQQRIADPNDYSYNSNKIGAGLNDQINAYNRPRPYERPILDFTGRQYQQQQPLQPQQPQQQYHIPPTNLEFQIYTIPNYQGNLGQNIYNRPSFDERPILDFRPIQNQQNPTNILPVPIYTNTPNNFQGGVRQIIYSQPRPTYQFNGRLGEQVNSRPSDCYTGNGNGNGNVGQNVNTHPSYYYPPNSNGLNGGGYINQQPIYPMHKDDSVEIINGYVYPKPNQPPRYTPSPIYPVHPTTTESYFPPATARISVNH